MGSLPPGLSGGPVTDQQLATIAKATPVCKSLLMCLAAENFACIQLYNCWKIDVYNEFLSNTK
jgi:hypothetical protein